MLFSTRARFSGAQLAAPEPTPLMAVLSSLGICSVWYTGTSDLEIPSEVMVAKEIPDPAGNELKTERIASALKQTLSIHIYTRRSMQVDSRILENSWGWSWGARGEPAWRPHYACIATAWLGTWQHLKVGRLGSQTRSLCKFGPASWS
jgi:hypothetical protein